MSGEPFVPTFLRELALARAALHYADQLHRGQRRESDEAPFVLHPLEVAALLHNTGHPEAVVAAGILHETIEDAGADPADLRVRFGAAVADLVRALTEDASIEAFRDRKAALRRQVAEFGDAAIAVDAADKVAKVRELRGRASRGGDALLGEDGQRKLEHYRESLDMLEQRAADHPLVRRLRFELEALHAMPPRTV